MSIQNFSIRLFSIFRFVMSTSIVVCVLSCQDESTNPQPVDNVDNSRPTIISISPSNGAANVSINVNISVNFSEAIDNSTLHSGTFFFDNNISGNINIASDNKNATFDPITDLDYSTTYTVTITSGVQDLAGNSMKSDYSWQFITQDAPVPIFTYPLSLGKQWLYDAYSRYGYVSAQGSSDIRFYGDYILLVSGENVFHNGRFSTELSLFELGDAGEFDVSKIYLIQSSAGVEMEEGGSWRTILSTQSTSFLNNAFLFSGSVGNVSASQISTAQVSVPAGTFNTLKTDYHFKETSQYASQHIWDDRIEYFADGVGVVKSFWDILIDDKDPMSADYFREGLIQLKYIDSGPFPDFSKEIEPNNQFLDSTLTVTYPFIVAGDAALYDQGNIVGGIFASYISPDANGERKVQDWFKVIATSSSPVKINLKYSGYYNDLDIYVFEKWKVQGQSYGAWFGKGTNPTGETELISGNFTAGHDYYIGIQAYDTPGGRSDYWVCVR